MATVTLTPNANSATNNTGWPDNGTPTYTRVTTNDGDTTNIYTPTPNSLITYPTTSAGLTSETINSVSVTTVIRPLDPNTSATTQAVLFIGSVVYTGATYDAFTSTPLTYQSATYTWTTNPATGAAWTVAALSGMEVGIKKINTAGERCTQIFGTVDYTAGGGFSNKRYLGFF